jgi:SAM-dependent methyltransferase
VTPFDAERYWDDRLTRRYGLDGVGYMGLAESYNAWMYRVRRRVFLAEARRLAAPSTARVLDVGSGTGFWVERWHELGVRSVMGSDLTEVAVENLRRRYPGDTFMRFDVGGDADPFGGERFDAVSMIDVAYHIVDDARFRRAFEALFALLKPGGVLLFSENFLHGETLRLPHQVSRPLTEIQRTVVDAGFRIVGRRPMFWLMNAPVDSHSRLHKGWWSLLERHTRRPRLGAALGALLCPLELALVSRRSEGPSTELMVCRRPAAAGPRAP